MSSGRLQGHDWETPWNDYNQVSFPFCLLTSVPFLVVDAGISVGDAVVYRGDAVTGVGDAVVSGSIVFIVMTSLQCCSWRRVYGCNAGVHGCSADALSAKRRPRTLA